MTSPQIDRRTRLLQRLDEIGQALEASGQAFALLALGSVGRELERLDAYSDLDYFAIVKPGAKQTFLDDTAWLSRPCPVVFLFRNTVDGFKYLYEDGIFCEMAVFEPHELARIPFAPGRVVWKAEGFDESILTPAPVEAEQHSAEWYINEALTNLYVGLSRFRRGELLAAQRLIQQHAVNHVLTLHAQSGEAGSGLPDIFAIERRYEQRFPDFTRHLEQFIQGYGRTPQSARATLDYLDTRYPINAALKQAILALLDDEPPMSR